jgi:hypothetical protein
MSEIFQRLKYSNVCLSSPQFAELDNHNLEAEDEQKMKASRHKSREMAVSSPATRKSNQNNLQEPPSKLQLKGKTKPLGPSNISSSQEEDQSNLDSW